MGALTVALTLVGCGSSTPVSSVEPGAVVELTQLAMLKAAFAEDEGKPRLLILLSPT